MKQYEYYNTWKLEDLISDIRCITCAKLPNESPEFYFFVFKHVGDIYNIKIDLEKEDSLTDAFKIAEERVKSKLLLEYSKNGKVGEDNSNKNLSRTVRQYDKTVNKSKNRYFITSNLNIKFKSGNVVVNGSIVNNAEQIGKEILKAAKDING